MQDTIRSTFPEIDDPRTLVRAMRDPGDVLSAVTHGDGSYGAKVFCRESRRGTSTQVENPEVSTARNSESCAILAKGSVRAIYRFKLRTVLWTFLSWLLAVVSLDTLARSPKHCYSCRSQSNGTRSCAGAR